MDIKEIVEKFVSTGDFDKLFEETQRPVATGLRVADDVFAHLINHTGMVSFLADIEKVMDGQLKIEHAHNIRAIAEMFVGAVRVLNDKPFHENCHTCSDKDTCKNANAEESCEEKEGPKKKKSARVVLVSEGISTTQ